MTLDVDLPNLPSISFQVETREWKDLHSDSHNFNYQFIDNLTTSIALENRVMDTIDGLMISCCKPEIRD